MKMTSFFIGLVALLAIAYFVIFKSSAKEIETAAVTASGTPLPDVGTPVQTPITTTPITVNSLLIGKSQIELDAMTKDVNFITQEVESFDSPSAKYLRDLATAPDPLEGTCGHGGACDWSIEGWSISSYGHLLHNGVEICRRGDKACALATNSPYAHVYD